MPSVAARAYLRTLRRAESRCSRTYYDHDWRLLVE